MIDRQQTTALADQRRFTNARIPTLIDRQQTRAAGWIEGMDLDNSKSACVREPSVPAAMPIPQSVCP